MGFLNYLKDNEIDFSDEKNIDYKSFIISEFFKASEKIKDEFKKNYKKKYGIDEFNYMINFYWDKWQQGEKNVNETQSYKIYYLMQSLLDDSAKHRLGMNEFIRSIKSTVKVFIATQKNKYSNLQSLNDIVHIFEEEINRINSLKLEEIVTIGINGLVLAEKSQILDEKEKKEALEISKYILQIKLQKTFNQVENDLKIFIPYILKFKNGIFYSKYSLTDFNLKLVITNTDIKKMEIPKFKIKEIIINSQFKKYSDKYIAYELVSIHKEASNALSNSVLNLNDLKLFFSEYQKLLNQKIEVNMNSTFQGEGGFLSLNAQLKPLKLLIKSILNSFFKITIYLVVCFLLLILPGFIYEICSSNLKLFALFILVCLVLFIIFAYPRTGLIFKEIKIIKSLIKEYKTYGK